MVNLVVDAVEELRKEPVMMACLLMMGIETKRELLYGPWQRLGEVGRVQHHVSKGHCSCGDR
jgi:hypothetical protein